MTELQKQLKHGDIREIARMVGVHFSTAEKTVYGTRNNAKVKEAAWLLIESRAKIKQQLEKQA